MDRREFGTAVVGIGAASLGTVKATEIPKPVRINDYFGYQVDHVRTEDARKMSDEFPTSKFVKRMTVPRTQGKFLSAHGSDSRKPDSPFGFVPYCTVRHCYPFGRTEEFKTQEEAVQRAGLIRSMYVCWLLGNKSNWDGPWGFRSSQMTRSWKTSSDVKDAILPIVEDTLSKVPGLCPEGFKLVVRSPLGVTVDGIEIVELSELIPGHAALVYQNPPTDTDTLHSSTFALMMTEEVVVEDGLTSDGKHSSLVVDSYSAQMCCPQTGWFFQGV